MAQARTDGRGNTTATVTDAQGNTSCYRYDARGRKLAEWGTGIQSPRGLGGGLDKQRSEFAPKGEQTMGYLRVNLVLFGYDDTDRMVTLHQRYIYRGYLQIAALDLTRSNHPALWFITWDPTQPIATRPLSIRINGTWYTYGWDLTKNICELYSTGGGIATSYTYTPFGKVTNSGNVTQPIQWSSEFHDTELGLVYYNYRYYNQNDRRWIRRDPVSKLYDYNVYALLKNKVYISDYLGLTPACVAGALAVMGRALLGASVGLAIRALGDLVEQELSTKREYLAAMVGGMIGGLIGNLHIGIIGGEIAESLIENYGNENIDYCSISMELISGISLSYIGNKFKIMPNIDEKLHKLIVGGVEEVHSVFIINIKREIKRIGIKTDKLSSIIYKEVKRSYRELTQEMLPTFTESLMSFFSGLNERINFNEDKHTNFDYGNIKFKGKVDIEADNEKYSDEIKSENYFIFPTNEK